MNASETNSTSDDIFRVMLQFASPYIIYTLLWEIHKKMPIKYFFPLWFSQYILHVFYWAFHTQWLIRTNGLVSVQRRIQNPVKHLRWSFLQKTINDWKDVWVGSEYVSAACRKSIKLTEIVNQTKYFWMHPNLKFALNLDLASKYESRFGTICAI